MTPLSSNCGWQLKTAWWRGGGANAFRGIRLVVQRQPWLAVSLLVLLSASLGAPLGELRVC